LPLRHIDRADLDYHLVLFDSDGNERPEQDGTLLSEGLSKVIRDDITDVFLSSHGWKGDIPAAISQYDSWLGAVAAQAADRDRARALDPQFHAMTVGVHWPSLPWGDEDVRTALLDDESDEFAVEKLMDSEELVQHYAERIADTDAARTALMTILNASDEDEVKVHLANGKLSPALEMAYRTLFEEAGLGLDGPAAAPGSDQQTFTPLLTISEWMSAAEGQDPIGPRGQPGLLGGGFSYDLKDALLMPVRQMSFWAMKHRARRVGETGVHTLLIELQKNAPKARFHLMGHSFGCIVISAAVSGPLSQGDITSRLLRPVHSLFLVQGALSLWSFAENIPFPPNMPGYFRPVKVPPTLVNGPIVTTRSTFDRAVGTFFPLAAKLGHERLLGEELPEFGGVGAFGIRGTAADTTHDMNVLNANAEYGFNAEHIYNIDASRIISHGRGPAGAHSDITHPEIAHIFWQTALTGLANP
jgi:hypothetical protein